MNRLTNKNDCWPPVVLLLKPNGSVVSFCVVYCILSIWILLLLKTDSDMLAHVCDILVDRLVLAHRVTYLWFHGAPYGPCVSGRGTLK